MKALLLIARLLGALRVMLVVSVFILIFFVILFDVLMCFVCRIDKPAIERQRFDSIVRIELALLVLMVAFWAPAFYRLLDTV